MDSRQSLIVPSSPSATSRKCAKRPSSWGGELSEDPILCSQVPVEAEPEAVGVPKKRRLKPLRSGGRGRSARASGTAQFRGSTISLVDGFHLESCKPPPVLAAWSRSGTAARSKPAPGDSTVSASSASQAALPATRRLSVTPLVDLKGHMQCGAAVDVEATVASVGELRQEELRLQPGEFVTERILLLSQDGATCQLRLWADDAERCGPELTGRQLCVRGARVHWLNGQLQLLGGGAQHVTAPL